MPEGYVIQDDPWAGFNVISVYTRKQAIEDGVLVDLSNNFPNETRMFKWNVACTSTVWSIIEKAAEEDCAEVAVYVWDVCYMGLLAINAVRDSGGQELFFNVCLPLGKPEKKLKLHCGPGDSGEPVLTIMLPRED
jgi:hypothetical protein